MINEFDIVVKNIYRNVSVSLVYIVNEIIEL